MHKLLVKHMQSITALCVIHVQMHMHARTHADTHTQCKAASLIPIDDKCHQQPTCISSAGWFLIEGIEGKARVPRQVKAGHSKCLQLAGSFTLRLALGEDKGK